MSSLALQFLCHQSYRINWTLGLWITQSCRWREVVEFRWEHLPGRIPGGNTRICRCLYLRLLVRLPFELNVTTTHTSTKVKNNESWSILLFEVKEHSRRINWLKTKSQRSSYQMSPFADIPTRNYNSPDLNSSSQAVSLTQTLLKTHYYLLPRLNTLEIDRTSRILSSMIILLHPQTGADSTIHSMSPLNRDDTSRGN